MIWKNKNLKYILCPDGAPAPLQHAGRGGPQDWGGHFAESWCWLQEAEWGVQEEGEEVREKVSRLWNLRTEVVVLQKADADYKRLNEEGKKKVRKKARNVFLILENFSKWIFFFKFFSQNSKIFFEHVFQTILRRFFFSKKKSSTRRWGGWIRRRTSMNFKNLIAGKSNNLRVGNVWRI